MSEAAREYARLLVLAHGLIESGKGEEEVEAISGEMGRPWYAMTDSERTAMVELSVALFEDEP